MRHISAICQRGSGSPGYHFAPAALHESAGRVVVLSRSVSFDASNCLCGPSAAVVHSAPVWFSVRRRWPAHRQADVVVVHPFVEPATQIQDPFHCSGVRERDPRVLGKRVTELEKSRVAWHDRSHR